MYRHLFGPVPSRRLGISLGVDLVPHKVCSYNCVYCECGRTTNLTLKRDEYVPAAEVLAELEDFFARHPAPDYVTFSGAGEPTLNSRLGTVLDFIKREYPAAAVAVLTNGSLFSDVQVRSELLAADVVLPSLDAASGEVFRRIDRPPAALSLESVTEGLVAFRQEYSGLLWLEVMILPGYNDDPAELERLRRVLSRIRPDRIQLNTLDRPGTLPGLRPAGVHELRQIRDAWDLPGTEIIAAAARRSTMEAYRDDIESAILETIARRPCTVEDLATILGTHVNAVNKYLGVLEGQGRLVSLRRERGVFYRLPPSAYDSRP